MIVAVHVQACSSSRDNRSQAPATNFPKWKVVVQDNGKDEASCIEIERDIILSIRNHKSHTECEEKKGEMLTKTDRHVAA